MPGPFARLTASLQGAASLKGHATVLCGRKKLPMTGAPRRIVLFPTTGTIGPPADRRSVADEPTVIAAHIWGHDEDDVEDLTVRLFQALPEQAAGDELKGTPAGFFWTYSPGTVEWETKPDTSEQGESKVVQFSVLLALDRVQDGSATVEAVRVTGTPDVGPIDIS